MQNDKPLAAGTTVNLTLLLWSCIVAANFFNTDASLVGMIAPTLITSLGLSQSLVSLTSAIFTLMVAAFLLGGAALGDIYGRKRIMMIGIMGETLMAALVLLTPDPALLLPIRTIAGIFAALISPTALTLVTVNFAAGPARARAISLYVIAFGVIGSLASVAIQFLNQAFGWRVPFGLFVVWGVLALIVVMRFVTESKGAPNRRMDWVGTALAAVGLFLLLFGINSAGARGFTSPDVMIPVLTGSVVLGILVVYSSRIAQPVFQVKLFKSTVFAFGLLLGVMLNVSYSASSYQANLLMQAVVKVPPVLAAIYLLPLAVGYIVVAPLPARLHGRVRLSLLLLVGSAILVVGTVLFGFVARPTINFFTFLLPALILGMGMALAQSFKTTAVLSEAPPELAGAASATNNVSNNLGTSLAVALSSALMGGFVLRAYHSLLEQAGLSASQISTAMGALSQAMTKTTAELADEFSVPVQVIQNLDAKATQAYIQGLTETLLVIGLLTLAVAIAVFFILRRKETKVAVATPDTRVGSGPVSATTIT